MLKWIKKLCQIVANYDHDMNKMKSVVFKIQFDMSDLDKLIKERTDIAVDIGFESSHVIIVGRYKKNDYVQTYKIGDQDLHEIIQHLKQLERHGTIRQIDSPPPMRAIFAKHFNLN
jgi:Tfp pilus assembly PilM family ATPase